jgi:hypothetical protein
MAELARYRRHYDLAALPYGGEMTPLLLPIGGTHRPRIVDARNRGWLRFTHADMIAPLALSG